VVDGLGLFYEKLRLENLFDETGASRKPGK
jgi:hypothetical protein